MVGEMVPYAAPQGELQPAAKPSRRALRSLGIPRLFPALRASRTAQKPYRENYHQINKMLAGADWSANGSDIRRPLNLAGKYLEIVSSALVNQTPRSLCSTWRREHTRTVWAAQEWMNRAMVKMDFGSHLHRWVLDSLVWMGILKTGVATPIDAKRKGYSVFQGESYAEVVNPSDHVCDMNATVKEQMTFEGNRFRADVETANKYLKLYGEKKLEGERLQTHDGDGDERNYMIGLGYEGLSGADFVPQTDLWEIHLPCHGVILICRSEASGTPGSIDDILQVRDYNVPEGGCYTWLTHILVPGQLLGKGPLMDLVGLDLSANNTLRKVMRQTERCKKNPIYSGEASDDMERLLTSPDGKSVRMQRPKEVGELETSSPSGALVAMVKLFKDLFSYAGGNMDVIGGLARQAGTARQEEMMNTNAGASMANMSRNTIRQTGVAMKKLGWGWWNDPQGVMTAYRYLKSTPNEMPIEQRVNPEDRQKLDWYEDINADVVPYSLVSDTPQGRLQHVRALINQVAPMLALFQQQGHGIDTKFWMQMEGEYSNNPDIERLMMMVEPMPGESSTADGPTKPPVTDRTYKHEGSGTQTDTGADEMSIQDLMGKGMADAGNFVEMG